MLLGRQTNKGKRNGMAPRRNLKILSTFAGLPRHVSKQWDADMQRCGAKVM